MNRDILAGNGPVAVIADVHGNSDALSAVLADIDALGCDLILNLGDHLSGPLAAAETLALIRSREMVSIRGNHDRWLVTQDRDVMGPSDRAAHDQLTRDDLDWLAALPATRTIGADIFMCHGTPASDTTYWIETVLPDGRVTLRDRTGIEAEAAGLAHPLILCAHTHMPRALRLSGDRLLVNPGSVGLPAYDDDQPVRHVMQTGTPDATYAVVRRQDGGWHVAFRHVPYDTRRMAALARDAGRCDWQNAVTTGWLHPQDGAPRPGRLPARVVRGNDGRPRRGGR